MQQKIQVVNFIKDGYDNNVPVLMTNGFLHYSAHIIARSIPIDLYALFGKANRNNQSAFGHIKKYKDDLIDGTIDKVEAIIKSVQGEVDIISDLRNQQMAHYDFDVNEYISLTLKYVPSLNKLFEVAKDIILMLGTAVKGNPLGIGYQYEREADAVISLERLLKKIN